MTIKENKAKKDPIRFLDFPDFERKFTTHQRSLKMTKEIKEVKETKDKKNSAFMKPVHVSETLAEIVGAGPMPRTEVTKKVWEYIKKHKLQDETNKRNINPDAKLGKVLGSTQAIDMFKMTGKISKHLTQPEDSATKK